MTECKDCDEWIGHLGAICRGEHPGMSLEHCNHHRVTGMGGMFKPLGPLSELSRTEPPGAQWDVTMPSRGLGDVVAKVTHYTGIKRVVDAVSTAIGVPCRCGQNQTALNQAVPFGG